MVAKTGSCLVPVILVLLLVSGISAFAADDSGSRALTTTVPVNETTNFSTGSFGGRGPSEYHEPEPSITLFRFELPQTEYPGPREMAFGPRYIQLTTNPPTLVIIGIAAAIAVMLWVIRRRRNAVADTGDETGDVPAAGNEKRD
jgi:hypothetical protein